MIDTFYKKVGIAVALPMSIIIGIFIAPEYQQTDNIYKLPNNIKTVFIGDSHINYGIHKNKDNDSIAVFAADSQSLTFTYAILKRIHENNTDLAQKDIFIGFSFHNLIDLKKRKSAACYAQYFHLLSKKQQKEYLINPTTNRLVFTRELLKNKCCKSIYTSKENTHNKEFQNTIEDSIIIKNRITYQFLTNNTLKPYPDSYEFNALKTIQSYGKKHNLAIHFLMTPLHNYYNELLPKNIRKLFMDTCYKSQIQLVDYSILYSKKEEEKYFMKDGDHLNQEGAKVFTSTLLKDLNKNSVPSSF